MATTSASLTRLAWFGRVGVLACIALFCASPSRAVPIGEHGYDASADPQVLFDAAVAQAKREHKRVLLVAGGDWCHWCMALEAFVERNDDVRRKLLGAFVVTEVYVGTDNLNEAFFSRLPPARGYPHFWVFSGDGTLIRSVETGDLEAAEDRYDKSRFFGFIRANAGR